MRQSHSEHNLRHAYSMLAFNMHTCLISAMIRKQNDPVGAMFHDIAHLIRLNIDETLRPYGLTRLKWLAIGIIVDNEGFSQAELATRLELKSAATGKLVDRLVERGLVARRPDPSDRRAYCLFATKKSNALLLDLKPLGASLRESVLHGLNETDVSTLKTTLARIKANLLNSAMAVLATIAIKSEFILPMV